VLHEDNDGIGPGTSASAEGTALPRLVRPEVDDCLAVREEQGVAERHRKRRAVPAVGGVASLLVSKEEACLLSPGDFQPSGYSLHQRR
jgi:hypothetical protein